MIHVLVVILQVVGTHVHIAHHITVAQLSRTFTLRQAPVIKITTWYCRAVTEIGTGFPALCIGTEIMASIPYKCGTQRESLPGDYWHNGARPLRIERAAELHITHLEGGAVEFVTIGAAICCTPIYLLKTILIGLYTVEDKGIERIDRIALMITAQCRLATGRLMIELEYLVLVVGQRKVHGHSHLTAGARLENLSRELQFHTLVERLGIVGIERRPASSRVEVDLSQNVGTLLMIDIKGTSETVGEYGEIESQIPRGSLLPAQLVVRRGIERGLLFAMHIIGGDAGGEIRGIVGIDISRNTIAQTEFQHIKPCERLHERLVLRIPAGSYRPERTAAELRVGSEEVGFVHTIASAYGISAVIGIVGSGII